MNWWLVTVGLLVHLVFFYSIFDIYFTSPLVHGMTPQSTPLPAPANRLVLFVADGLRADKLFELDENGTSRAPYIRHIIENEGGWGVSHTRVPTESRPGHVALIAGFYEDVSAVARGWKENPVNFDSVFNESSYTWSWGSPDILPMFAKGATGEHVFMETYPAESEDFAGSDLSKLDTFVFDRVEDFLNQAKKESSLNKMVNEKKVVFFLHLLGLDTNGHAHRPYSEDYLHNIVIVDKGVEHIVKKFNEHYQDDGKTAYVFTSDHGMTNWGSHGAGHPTETLTPLVVWGAGVRKPQKLDYSKYGDNDNFYHDDDIYSKDWKLESVKRVDVNQADIASLMAALIGISFPLNSVGVLPLDYLNGSDEFKAQSIFTNAREIMAQFEVKMIQKQQTTLSLLFTPFKPLTPSKQAAFLRSISGLIKAERYAEAIRKSQDVIQLALQGLNYYHNYDKFFLGTSIAFGFLGWIGYTATLVLRHHTPLVRPRLRLEEIILPFWQSEKGIRLIFTSVATFIILLLYVQSLPWTHYMYCILPVYLWHKIAQQYEVFTQVYHYVVDRGYLWQVVSRATMGFLGLEILVVSFFYREVLSVGLVAMAVWPFYTPLWKSDKDLVLGWLMCCLMVAVFPLMPVVGREANYPIVCVAGIVAFLMAVAGIVRPEVKIVWLGRSSNSYDNVRKLQILSALQLVLMGLSIYVVRHTASSITEKQGLPLHNQIMSWCILALSFVLPMFSSSQVYTRMLHIGMSFIPPYLLLSTSHESVFVLALCFLLFFWLQVEHQLSERFSKKLEEMDFSEVELLGERQRYLVMSDLRCAYFFIFFLLASFFGTGNIASINSFDPRSVYCFLTVFSPFTMGALILWKVLIPFLFVTCTFNAIHVSVNVPTQSLFLLVLLMSDFMGLHFFFLVRDYGSWLEIGTSISHFVIVMSMICFLMLLLGLSKVLTSYQWNMPAQNRKKLKI